MASLPWVVRSVSRGALGAAAPRGGCSCGDGDLARCRGLEHRSQRPPLPAGAAAQLLRPRRASLVQRFVAKNLVSGGMLPCCCGTGLGGSAWAAADVPGELRSARLQLCPAVREGSLREQSRRHHVSLSELREKAGPVSVMIQISFGRGEQISQLHWSCRAELSLWGSSRQESSPQSRAESTLTFKTLNGFRHVWSTGEMFGLFFPPSLGGCSGCLRNWWGPHFTKLFS